MNGLIGSKATLGSPEAFFTSIAKLTHAEDYSSTIEAITVVGSVASATITEKGYANAISFTDFFHLVRHLSAKKARNSYSTTLLVRQIKLDGKWKIMSKLFQGDVVKKKKK
jgi:hypothetical protein